MKCNVGMIDRIIRFVVAIIFFVIAVNFSWWWLIVTAVALITGILGWCGLYKVLGISTCKKVAVKKTAKKKKSRR